MRKTSATIVALLLFGPLCGCGTMANVTGNDEWLLGQHFVGPPRPFGGVIMDTHMVVDDTGSMTLALIDLPFSIVGDMITLPWTSFVYARGGMAPSPIASGPHMMGDHPMPFDHPPINGSNDFPVLPANAHQLVP